MIFFRDVKNFFKPCKKTKAFFDFIGFQTPYIAFFLTELRQYSDWIISSLVGI